MVLYWIILKILILSFSFQKSSQLQSQSGRLVVLCLKIECKSVSIQEKSILFRVMSNVTKFLMAGYGNLAKWLYSSLKSTFIITILRNTHYAIFIYHIWYYFRSKNLHITILKECVKTILLTWAYPGSVSLEAPSQIYILNCRIAILQVF